MLQKKVAGNFEEDVRDEEEEERDVEVVSFHIQICLQSLNPSISNIDPFLVVSPASITLSPVLGHCLPVDKTAQLQNEQDGDQVQVGFPKDLFLENGIDRFILVLLVGSRCITSLADLDVAFICYLFGRHCKL